MASRRQITYSMHETWVKVSLSQEVKTVREKIKEFDGRTVLLQDRRYSHFSFTQAKIRVDMQDKQRYYVYIPNFKDNSCQKVRLYYADLEELIAGVSNTDNHIIFLDEDEDFCEDSS